jgi:MFS family permease
MTNVPSSDPGGSLAGDAKIWSVGTLKYTTLGLVILFSVLLWGDFASSMKERSVSPVFQTLLHKFGASDFLFGIIGSSVGAGINMIMGPIIAYKSDRHRGRWGRRIPFVFFSTPFIALSMAGLGFSPMLGPQLHGFLGPNAPSPDTCVIIVLSFFWVVYDLASIVGGAVFGGLINDVVPQQVLGRFFGLFRAISLIAGILFNTYLMGYAETSYLEIYVGMALLFGFGYSFMCLNLKEGEYPPPPPAGPHGALGFFHAAKGYFVECFSIPYYWLYFAATIFAGLAAVPINTFMIPFAASLHIQQNFGHYLAITYTISLCLAYPLGALVDRVHPLPLGLGVMVLYTLGTFWGGFYSPDAHMYGTALIIHGVLSGTYGTITASLGQRLLPRANFAQFAAAGGLLNSIVIIFIPPYIGRILDQSGHLYYYIFFMSSAFGAVASCLLLMLYLKFLKLGGPKGYIAPDRVPDVV